MRENQTFTIEVEYGNMTNWWQFDSTERTPQQAKDYLTSRIIPSDETIHRIGGWWGVRDDRPDSGHEDGIFAETRRYAVALDDLVWIEEGSEQDALEVSREYFVKMLEEDDHVNMTVVDSEEVTDDTPMAEDVSKDDIHTFGERIIELSLGDRVRFTNNRWNHYVEGTVVDKTDESDGYYEALVETDEGDHYRIHANWRDIPEHDIDQKTPYTGALEADIMDTAPPITDLEVITGEQEER